MEDHTKDGWENVERVIKLYMPGPIFDLLKAEFQVENAVAFCSYFLPAPKHNPAIACFALEVLFPVYKEMIDHGGFDIAAVDAPVLRVRAHRFKQPPTIEMMSAIGPYDVRPFIERRALPLSIKPRPAELSVPTLYLLGVPSDQLVSETHAFAPAMAIFAKDTAALLKNPNSRLWTRAQFFELAALGVEKMLKEPKLIKGRPVPQKKFENRRLADLMGIVTQTLYNYYELYPGVESELGKLFDRLKAQKSVKCV